MALTLMEIVVVCGDCGSIIGHSPEMGMAEWPWPPCPDCGGISSRFTTQLEDGRFQGFASSSSKTLAKERRPGERKWKQESVRDPYSFSRVSGHRKLFMYDVDRRRNAYRKRLVDTVTGAWFEQFGFLTAHQGHGSAKRREGEPSFFEGAGDARALRPA